ncbi:plasmid stabilization system protein ParE [Blastomonas natatoria]|uniref:Plasmid stabilization system protein ParE n=1 Tax=Blastomonas natatoria TaxID=34015 RepID=A0A2V3V909_9SPHN|nr:type II toxin-antitoxin system RelE/ParE family toxin [Blastomonas natatoria]PXW77644.1 plasmid stabilization system protein ParE [Blastomonas natatoria]
MKQLIWSPTAQADLAAVDDFLYDEDPDFADRVALSSVRSARLLLDWPFAGSPWGDGGQHKWRVKQTPYILIYRPVDDAIVILHVLHERQNWGIEP